MAERIRDEPDLLRGDIRIAFFLHLLDLTQPLETPFGDLKLTKPLKKPKRLSFLTYEEPD